MRLWKVSYLMRNIVVAGKCFEPNYCRERGRGRGTQGEGEGEGERERGRERVKFSNPGIINLF